jgi:hypothetical protein
MHSQKLLAEGERFNETAIPAYGFGDDGEMNDVLGPAEEGETNVVLVLRAVLNERAAEAALLDSIAQCRRLYVRGLTKTTKRTP